MAVTDAQFAALVARVKALEDYQTPKKVKAIQDDLDNAHTAFVQLRDDHDTFCVNVKTNYTPRAITK